MVVKLLFGVLLHHWGVRMLTIEINEKKRKLQEGKKDVGEGEDEAPILSDRKVMSIEKMMADNDALLTPNFKVAM